jgi:hypothetical protein
MRGGIKSNSTCQTSRDVHTVVTISRHCEWLSMRTAAFVGFTFRIDCTVRRNCHLNSSCSYPFKSSNEWSYSSNTVIQHHLTFFFYQ